MAISPKPRETAVPLWRRFCLSAVFTLLTAYEIVSGLVVL